MEGGMQEEEEEEEEHLDIKVSGVRSLDSNNSVVKVDSGRDQAPLPTFASMLAHMVTLPREDHPETSMVSNHLLPLPSQTQCLICGEEFLSVRRAIIHEVYFSYVYGIYVIYILIVYI